MVAYQEHIEDNISYRTFKPNQKYLHWHTDNEDRYIYIDNDTDWLIQYDNCIPQKIENEMFIPKGTYHRLIAGKNILHLIVKKINK